MSILLDALRKSEQQQRLGSAPDIHSPEALTRPGDRRPWRRQVLALALLLVALVLAYLAWTWWSRPAIPVAPPEWQEDVVDAVADTPSPTSGANAAAAAETAMTLPSVRLDAQPRSPVETLSGNSPYRPAGGSDQPGEQAGPSARESAEPDRTPDPETVSRNPTERPALATAATAPDAASDGSESGSKPASSRPPDEGAAPAEPRDPPRDEDAGLISYWQLPQHTRDNLPDFKINVLVYDADAKRRFIIMGGKRYREGARFNESLRLLQIRRDRVVFRYGVYRFYVTQ